MALDILGIINRELPLITKNVINRMLLPIIVIQLKQGDFPHRIKLFIA
jgi:hypothetical protein